MGKGDYFTFLLSLVCTPSVTLVIVQLRNQCLRFEKD